ncbi:MAG: hypothetical protein JWQ78_1903, partial [Sediminibacterium sp.]|nr:hypothetical protein [Sediminibacterium sp.]
MPSKSKKATSSKKDLRDKLSIQLHMVLAAFKESESEKKLEKLVKKTAKQLAEALH